MKRVNSKGCINSPPNFPCDCTIRYKTLSKTSGKFCVKDYLSVADICLIPQVYNANRFGVDLSSYPTIHRINEAVLDLQWTKLATPEEQKDANC